MNRINQWAKYVFIFSAAFLLAGCAIWKGGLPPFSKVTDKYPIVASVHGIKKVSYSDDLHQIVISYTPTNEIILDTNTIHGWLIKIDPPKKAISVREVFILPKPAHWPNSILGRISPDRTTCVTDFVVPKGVKYLNGSWGMFGDDPLGKYQIFVFLDERLAAKFEFNVLQGTRTASKSKQETDLKTH
jgi:hypothetical protein